MTEHHRSARFVASVRPVNPYRNVATQPRHPSVVDAGHVVEVVDREAAAGDDCSRV
jgi:hypothetical protein